MDNSVGRLQSLFPSHQLDVIIGSLLGDGRLECRSKGIRVCPKTARLRIQQSEKQKDYVSWKYEFLKNLVSREPRKILAWRDKLRNKEHYSWYFHTRSSENLGLLYEYFYPKGVKILPKNIFQLVNPFCLAVWFMDDGSNTRESFTINSHCFSLKDQQRITKFLFDQYRIKATLIKDRKKYKIRIGKKFYRVFSKIISPFIIPSMIYKIDNPRNDLLPN